LLSDQLLEILRFGYSHSTFEFKRISRLSDRTSVDMPRAYVINCWLLMLGFGYSHNTFEFKPCHFSDRTFADMQRAYVINCSPFAEWIFGTDEPFICCLGHRAV